jgi:hypothetical protein
VIVELQARDRRGAEILDQIRHSSRVSTFDASIFGTRLRRLLLVDHRWPLLRLVADRLLDLGVGLAGHGHRLACLAPVPVKRPGQVRAAADGGAGQRQ